MRRDVEAAVGRVASLVAIVSLVSLLASLLWLVGRPVGTDDVWWHLALGERYAAQGPLLAEDPLLHTAERPPAPVAWLFDVALHASERALGFQGLRVLHVGLVAGILALAYALFRRESGSRLAACLATSVLLSLAWYRFMQLRAALFTILAVLLLYRLLLEDARLSWRRVFGSAALFGIWANVHAAFLIGPLLIAAALLGSGIREIMIRWGRARSGSDLPGDDSNAQFAGRLVAALVLGLLVSLLNPQGFGQHLTLLDPTPSPELSHVADDWMPFDPLAFGDVRTRLGPLIWVLTDALLLLVPGLGIAAGLRFLRRPTRRALHAADPVLFGVTAASLVAILSAIRFQWLAVFPLLYVLRAGKGLWGEAREHAPSWRLLPALGCAALVPAFLLSSGYAPSAFGVPSKASDYLEMSFSSGKYYSHSVWFLRDAELEGKLWNDYFMGGYLGYWLAPRIRCFVNGTLNFPPDVGVDFAAIKDQRGVRPGERFLDVLERRSVNLVLGVGLPMARDPRLARLYTTPLLEGAPGWLLVFRDLRSAVYLRDDVANAENLRRVQRYYARAGVPFDPARGFDALAAERARPAWAVAHGLVPSDFKRIRAASRAPKPRLRARALDRLAGLYGALGAHEEQVILDTELLGLRPNSKSALRRLVQGLLLLGRPDEALSHAQTLQRIDARDARPRVFLAIARRAVAQAGDAPPARDAPVQAPEAAIHRLPVLTNAEAVQLVAGVERPPMRRK